MPYYIFQSFNLMQLLPFFSRIKTILSDNLLFSSFRSLISLGTLHDNSVGVGDGRDWLEEWDDVGVCDDIL